MFTSKMPFIKIGYKLLQPTCTQASVFRYERKVFDIVQKVLISRQPQSAVRLQTVDCRLLTERSTHFSTHSPDWLWPF